jgi:hypothetical protein
MVVLPAASRPTIRMRISFLPNIRSQMREKASPMVAAYGFDDEGGGTDEGGGNQERGTLDSDRRESVGHR